MNGYELRVIRDVKAALEFNGNLIEVVPYKDMLKLVSDYFEEYELELVWSNLAGDIIIYSIKEPLEKYR